MDHSPQIWQTWTNSLDRWGLRNLVATLLEALGPLNLLAAQVVYIGQPLFTPIFSVGHMDALANLLENPQETQAFISALRGSDDPLEV